MIAAWFPLSVLTERGSGGEAYVEGPPPAHTGGFGEPTCQQCHSGNPLNEPHGRLALTGLPETYRAGEQYRLSIILTRPGLGVGGFQVAARTRDEGRQAGVFAPTDDRTALAAAPTAAVQYLQHTRRGTVRWATDTARWDILWRAPRRAGAVTFHIAANAGSDDNSPLDDFIYTSEIVLLPRP